MLDSPLNEETVPFLPKWLCINSKVSPLTVYSPKKLVKFLLAKSGLDDIFFISKFHRRFRSTVITVVRYSYAAPHPKDEGR